ncbi:transcription initiation factor TFIID subunit 10 [Trichomonascus vanleenenianus]|uniref:Taf10p n=1 Tax=Trichomonascus vanleenenianus TaxID=2268995 RepID=UPI003ECAB824
MSDVEMKEAHEVGSPEEKQESPKEEETKEAKEEEVKTEEKSDEEKSDEKEDEGNLDDAELKDVDKEVIEDDVEEEQNEKKRKAEEDEEYKDPVPPPPPSLQRKDKSLKEFLNSMDDYAPIIPDAVTDYYLAKSGFDTSDRRIKRLLALATQKFVSDIASDAYQFSRIRSSSSVASSSNPQARARALVAGMAGASAQQPVSGQSAPSGGGAGQGRIVLTMEDLGNALAEYGLNIKRPDFYR